MLKTAALGRGLVGTLLRGRLLRGRLLLGPLLLGAGISQLACRDQNTSPSSRAQTTSTSAPLRVQRGVLVARALGAMGPLKKTNSIEALKCNYERGFRWFEVDLALTADGELVCFHPGDEKLAELPQEVNRLTLAELEGKKYAGLYGIVSLPALLSETERLEDVTLLADTRAWSDKMLAAVAHSFRGIDKAARRTRIVLQAYEEADIDRVQKLGQDLGAGLILNLDRSSAGDEQVEALVKKHSFLAVVTDSKRFTPWLAQQLHALEVPLLVHTMNEHRDIVKFMRAGADGFYTDRYVPYGTLAADPSTATSCAPDTDDARNPWSERDAMQKRHFRFGKCAKRRGRQIELAGCDDRPALHGAYVALMPGQAVHVELEAQAGPAGARLWLDLVHEATKVAAKPRQEFGLKPNERRSWELDVRLPEGSAGLETRLGMLTKDRVSLHRFKVSQLDGSTDGKAAGVPQDAGD